jgi:hypothetical protein
MGQREESVNLKWRFLKMKTKTKQNSPASSTIVRTSLITISLLGSLFAASPATAASACKGLQNDACTSSASCGWVETYQRKDGRTVKSFCRTKSGTRNSTKKPSVAKQLLSTNGKATASNN